MSPVIEIQNLTKRFGNRTAVNQLDLMVKQGDIFGFVGPNGAGKTTTIRMMATLLQPDAGDILINGHSVRKSPFEVRKLIGYMPDYFGVYPEMRVWEYLDFFAACYQIPESARKGLIEGLLELVDLAHRSEDQLEALSRGMRQRLSLARALIHDPQVLLLDEPASGLDPRARLEIRELLVELSRLGKTVFFSTHILSDVAEISTHVGILEAGSLVAVGAPEDLQGQLLPHRLVHITLLGNAQEALAYLQNFPGVNSVQEHHNQNDGLRRRLEVEFIGEDAGLSALLAELVSQGFPIVHFSEDRRGLEQVFMRATKGQVT